ncbi:MAG TPA: hypothetical protein VM345_17850 [Acidimicrobiales bacterium]|nr:hypothetical protein [Acidimicrobiales bacterium]
MTAGRAIGVATMSPPVAGRSAREMRSEELVDVGTLVDVVNAACTGVRNDLTAYVAELRDHLVEEFRAAIQAVVEETPGVTVRFPYRDDAGNIVAVVERAAQPRCECCAGGHETP